MDFQKGKGREDRGEDMKDRDPGLPKKWKERKDRDPEEEDDRVLIMVSFLRECYPFLKPFLRDSYPLREDSILGLQNRLH